MVRTIPGWWVDRHDDEISAGRYALYPGSEGEIFSAGSFPTRAEFDALKAEVENLNALLARIGDVIGAKRDSANQI